MSDYNNEVARAKQAYILPVWPLSLYLESTMSLYLQQKCLLQLLQTPLLFKQYWLSVAVRSVLDDILSLSLK